MKKRLLKRKKKGFTLIELLAVILILGIIALIAIPTVNSVIEQSRKGAFESTVRNVIKAVGEGCLASQLSNIEYPDYIEIKNGESNYPIDLKGTLPNEAFIHVNRDTCDVSLRASSGKYMAIKEFDEEELTIDDYDESLFDDEGSDEGDEPGINAIEYIESSGAGNSGQYIDTGIKGSSKLRIVTDMLPIKAGIQFFYGARLGDSSTNAFLFVCEQSTGTKFRFDYSVTKRYITEVYDKKMHIDHNKNTFTVTDEDGNSLGSNTVGINTFSLEQNVYIFALNQGGSPYNHAKMRLYGMKIYDDDVLVRDFVPALDPEGVPCLYDQVTETYFMNKGSGSFSYPQ